MTSYFEIAGEVIECYDVLTSPEFKTFVKESAVPLSSAAIEARTDLKIPVLSADKKDSLFVHWLKTSTVPLRKLGPSMLISTGSIKNPYVFAAQGIGVISTVPGMHYDYFVKGESRQW